jgi:hypothetical protein
LVLPSPNVKDDCTYGVQLLGTLQYDRIDIQSKIFNGANSIPVLYRLLKNYASITRSGSQPDLVLPSPNVKDDCTYGVQLLGTLKYDRINIQSKVFNGANSIPVLYRLIKNYASITRSGSQPDLVLPSPNEKDDCTCGVQLLGTLKYDRIDIQSKVFNGAYSIPLLYRLLKNNAKITRSGSQPYLVLPSPNVKDDCTYGVHVLGTL